MRQMPLAAALGLSLSLAYACSSQKKGSEFQGDSAKSSGLGDATPVAELDTNTALMSGSTTADAAVDTAAATPGLPSFCTYKAPAAEGKSATLSCTPRQIPVLARSTIPAGFDPAKDCSYTATQMSCTVAAADKPAWIFKFDQKTLAETAYEDLPMLIAGLKSLVTSHLAKLPGASEIANKLLDIVAANRDTLFKAVDPTPFLTEVEALMKTSLPILGFLDLGALNPQISAGITALRDAAESQVFAVGHLTDFVQGILAMLPVGAGHPGSIGSALSGVFDLNHVLAGLTAARKDASSDYSHLANLQQMSVKIQTIH